MNQPPGYPPGGPPQYPGQPGFPPQGQAPQAQAPQAPPPQGKFGGTMLMPSSPQAAAAAQAQAQAAQQGAYGQPPPQAGAPGAPPPFGAPPGAPGFGQPPPAYGQPPPGQPGFGQPPPAYGGPPGGAPYGAPQPGYPMQAQPGGMASPYAAPQGFGTPGAIGLQPGAGKPQVRNALMTFLLPAILAVGGVIAGVIVTIVGGVADGATFALLGTLIYGLGALAGGVLGLISAIKMIGELNGVTRSGAVQWWMLLIPFYSIYVAWIVLPGEVAKAKQMVNAQQPPRGIVVYIFLWLYAFAADLNDIAKAMP